MSDAPAQKTRERTPHPEYDPALEKAIKDAAHMIILHGGSCSTNTKSHMHPGFVWLEKLGFLKLEHVTPPNPGETWFTARMFNFQGRFGNGNGH